VDVGPASSDVYLPAQPVPEGLDYDRWLGPAPWQPYHKLRCGSYYEDGWRRIRDYSGGKMTDWGAHHFDIAQWGLGMDESGPVEIIPPEGDGVSQLTYRYANGVTMVKGGANGVRFVGTKGEIEVNRGHLRSSPEAIIQQPIGRDDLRLYRSPGHHQDWLECIRTRRRPICDVEIGCRSATVCHLGNIALWTRRSIRWDPARERIIGDDEAARWLDRPKRSPYTM
jgi:predicted dehydrogenase